MVKWSSSWRRREQNPRRGRAVGPGPQEHDKAIQKHLRKIRKLDIEIEKHLSKIEKQDAVISDLQRELDWRRIIVCPGLGRTMPPVEEANVSLDPDTAHPRLVLSEDRKHVKWEDARQELPDSLEEFDPDPSVLGCEGFTSGRHCWEVEVEEGGSWAVGVARESVSRKEGSSLNPEGGIWAVQRCWWGQFQALTSPAVTPLPLTWVPSRIRVCLDCERGQVTFFDAGNEAPIFTFPPASVTGERFQPWLCVGDSETQLRLYP
ncbi:butyrophilin subfamily 2 member A2-like isoform X1 [Gopherus flavomarginatus]|uniref:butyrophilin subfamily 2 member A2-like isoform X1 n=1 Tax=Gopherus flavomarginatus TaxID=286002 RepID=UPI0021CC25DE|nr:butyrophilin subfamily 2 member A2-like isoform X1 [Gopherus flavomarginatus]